VAQPSSDSLVGAQAGQGGRGGKCLTWVVRGAKGNQIGEMRNGARVLQVEPTLSFVRRKCRATIGSN
jgi:hypothetical protein